MFVFIRSTNFAPCKLPWDLLKTFIPRGIHNYISVNKPLICSSPLWFLFQTNVRGTKSLVFYLPHLLHPQFCRGVSNIVATRGPHWARFTTEKKKKSWGLFSVIIKVIHSVFQCGLFYSAPSCLFSCLFIFVSQKTLNLKAAESHRRRQHWQGYI